MNWGEEIDGGWGGRGRERVEMETKVDYKSTFLTYENGIWNRKLELSKLL